MTAAVCELWRRQDRERHIGSFEVPGQNSEARPTAYRRSSKEHGRASSLCSAGRIFVSEGNGLMVHQFSPSRCIFSSNKYRSNRSVVPGPESFHLQQPAISNGNGLVINDAKHPTLLLPSSNINTGSCFHHDHNSRIAPTMS